MMKKRLMMAIVAGMLTVANICGAADGATLNKQQKIAENYISAIHSSDSSAHAKVVKTFHPFMCELFEVEEFEKLQDNVRNRYGMLMTVKFRAYEKYDQGDCLIYDGKYSKQNVHIVVLVDGNGKIMGGKFIADED